ncbi:MAG TPA: DUF1574 domain-containing protein [Cyanobacteria bacterium UBA8803]|nr:DUF1574 domain-containing protein [Cyanobacteria bacterium UBA9273]HBL57675.1 DUF1574 domain-containing protein [Cyanobacteria bacterium UBA8803]
MLDVDQRNQKGRPSSLAQWAYDAIGQPGVYLRVRLRGNNLHILCESRDSLDAKTVVNRLLKALQGKQGRANFPTDLENPIYQIIIYGRTVKNQRPDWIKEIRLKSTATDNANVPQAAPEASVATATTRKALIVSTESLARSGSPDAIARYLSANLSYLGVSIKVQIQDLPTQGQPDKSKEHPLPPIFPNRRLWVICNSNYSPDLSLLAEPVVEQLRSLQLKGFRDAAICSQVSGETVPEWMLRVDLTPAAEMLEDWAQWGDVQAIARLLNQTLNSLGIEVRAVLKEATLHLFCRLVAGQGTLVPNQQATVSAIAAVFESLAPQGLKAATLYGVQSHQLSLDPEQELPSWIDWLNLPAAAEEELSPSTFSLAQKGNLEALTFLLERLLNPEMDRRLATGGIQLKIRRKQDLLHVMSEAPICPLQAQVGPPIARFLRQLSLPEVGGVRVYGRCAGATSPVWNYGVDFVTRRRLAPEVTPEFTTPDTYVSALVAPTEELVEQPELTEEDLKDDLQWISQATVRFVQRLLCYSQLFVPSLDNQDLTIGVQRSSSETAQGVKVAMVWGFLSLLVTFQVDWLMGQILRVKTPPQVGESAAAAMEEPPVSLSLPQVSLKQGDGENTDNFNSSGFTRQGDKSVIIDNSSNPKRGNANQGLLAVARSLNPPFNNPLLDQKLALYQQRFVQSGPPDVLIMGSSRALRGVDPLALREALAAQGYSDVEIFNFAVNGATAQVVDLIVRRILTPEQLPKLIIWADGARAFNSGRDDATYNAIATSEGYAHLNAGTFPNLGGSGSARSDQTDPSLASLRGSYKSVSDWLNQSLAKVSSTYPQRSQLKSVLREQFSALIQQAVPQNPNLNESQSELAPEDAIDIDGFLPLSVRFNPATYYQNHPRVAGAYDTNYQSFKLTGKQDQALEVLMQFARANNINIVFVNLPLTKDYLDPVRSGYEQQFQKQMHAIALERGLIFRDLSNVLLDKPDYFSDPSHLNRYGANEVSNRLASDPMIPWSLVIGH